MPVLTTRVDIANVRVRFASGCIANITASRISRDKVRKIRFFQPDMYVSIDYAAQEVEVLAPASARRASGRAIEGGEVAGRRDDEPLARELADFVDAVRDSRRSAASPATTAAARSRWRSGLPTDGDADEGATASSSDAARDRSADINAFIAELDRRSELARITEPSAPTSRSPP